MAGDDEGGGGVCAKPRPLTVLCPASWRQVKWKEGWWQGQAWHTSSPELLGKSLSAKRRLPASRAGWEPAHAGGVMQRCLLSPLLTALQEAPGVSQSFPMLRKC